MNRTALAVFLSFLGVLLVGALLVYSALRDQRDAQIAACERGNDLRAQLNDQNLGFLAHNEITFRIFEESGDEAIRRSVPDYKRIATLYRALGNVDCEEAVDEPTSYEPPPPRSPTREELKSVLHAVQGHAGRYGH